MHEADEPYSLVSLLDADALTGEDGAEIDLALFVANSAAGRDGYGLVMEGIVEVGQASIGAVRRAVEFGWAAHAEGLVGSLGVVAVDEVVEAGLLLQKVRAGGLCGFELQGQMHALMAAVFLRTAWLDALDLDAEPEPPDRQLREVEQRIGAGEGHAIVRADGRRQTKLLEEPLENREGVGFFGGGEGFAADEIAAGEVGDGERIAIAPVGQHELALVIGAPQRIGLKGMGKGGALPQLPPALAAALHQAMAVEHGVDRADRRQMNIGMEPPEPFADLWRAPTRFLLLQAHDQLLDLERKLIGLAIGPPGAVRQRFKPASVIAALNLVAGLARDAELPAEAGHLLAVQEPRDEFEPFIHGFAHFPGHFASPRKRPDCVTHVSGMNCHPSLRKGTRVQPVCPARDVTGVSGRSEGSYAAPGPARSTANRKSAMSQSRPGSSSWSAA